MAATAALALAGCAADYVGDDWQCPLAQGKVCASVAAADPAVPATRGTAGPAGDIPPHRRIDGRIAAGAPAGRVEPACESDCDPFAWLAGLFAGPANPEPGEPERADAARDSDIGAVGKTASRRNTDAATAAADTSAGPGEISAAPAHGTARDAADAAGQPASRASGAVSSTIVPAVPDDGPSPATDRAAGGAGTAAASGPAAPDALRTGEVVARIWIAPFVDADGIYREGSWVRAVIAPSAWRLR